MNDRIITYFSHQNLTKIATASETPPPAAKAPGAGALDGGNMFTGGGDAAAAAVTAAPAITASRRVLSKICNKNHGGGKLSNDFFKLNAHRN